MSKKKAAAQSAHAKFPPSGAKRWLECPGSIGLTAERIKLHGEPEESDAAKDGTEVHKALELHLKNTKGATEFIRKTYGVEIAERVHRVVWDAWGRKKGDKNVILLPESKADLTFIDPDFYGTADITLVEDFGRLTVIDYKNGFLPVEVKENPQLIAYALGKAHEYNYNFSEVALVVNQPRADHEDGPVREWVTDIKTLKRWAKIFKKGIQAARAAEAEPTKHLKSGEHCRFCPAKLICPEQSTRALEQAGVDFDELDGDVQLPAKISKEPLSPELLALKLNACGLIENWIGELREHAFKVLKSGGKIPGWKLVEKRPMRRWNDPAKVERLASRKFGKDAYKAPELLSPAQLEKVAGKEWVNKFSSKVSSGLTLASESDRRPETSTVQNDFADDI
jgi:hypothetical protein